MIWTGAVLLVVGLVLIVAGIIGTVAAAATLINGFGSPVNTPTTVTSSFEAGTTYAVYEQTGSATLGVQPARPLSVTS